MRAIEGCRQSRRTRCSGHPSFFGRDIFRDGGDSVLALDPSGRRCRHGVLSDFRADPQESFDYGRGQGHKAFGDDVCGRNPHLIAVKAGRGTTGIDIIVCAVGESAGRSGEVAAVSVLCYPVGEFAGGRERVQAGVDTAAEAWAGRDGFRARLGGDVVGEFAVGGPYLGCGPSEGRVEPV